MKLSFLKTFSGMIRGLWLFGNVRPVGGLSEHLSQKLSFLETSSGLLKNINLLLF